MLAAARDEFTERGFRDARIDDIAERAELTRGAVYSNFPGKRALYFAGLADAAERAPEPPHGQPGRTPARRSPPRLAGDGVVAFLGLHRLEAAEEAVRAAPRGAGVTAHAAGGRCGQIATRAMLST